MATAELFEVVSHVGSYFKFRPVYSTQIFDRMMAFLAEKRPPPHELLLDVGCGTGQSTHGMSAFFQRVIGSDFSNAQIDAAKKSNTSPNVSFVVSASENMPFDDCSVDLVTSAQAAHWFDFPVFCEEAKRVLKPGGALAVYAYEMIPWIDHKNPGVKAEMANILNELYYDVLGSYWEPGRKHVEKRYTNFTLPFEESIRDDTLEMRMKWTVSHLTGYIETWSAYKTYLEENPDGHELLEEFEKKVMAVMTDGDGTPSGTKVTAVFSVFMLLGRK